MGVRRHSKRVSAWIVILTACGLAVFSATASAQESRQGEVRVAAAADLKFALDDVQRAFAQTHPGIHVTIAYGSSGNFFAQLCNQAPFDVFFSADMNYPEELVRKGLAGAGPLSVYAVGQLVVWVPRNSTLDPARDGIKVLTNPAVRKIAIANPKHAPYGRAAEATLKHYGLYGRVKDRLVVAENIAQTAQWVENGAADVGLIARSLADAPALRDKGRSWIVPADAHPPLKQAVIVLRWAQDPKAAQASIDFVKGAQGRAILKQYGFQTPGE